MSEITRSIFRLFNDLSYISNLGFHIILILLAHLIEKMLQKNLIVGTLISISIVGIIGIPMGDPQFLTNAIILESAFIGLTVLSVWRLQYALIPNIIIAIIVIIGNTASPKHIEIMTTFNPIGNAIVLIIGGYMLQGLLLVTSSMELKNRRQSKPKKI